ncbi:hypothetical protein CEXT_252651 [Caerostris extrusa]|uniref:Uncharacterized protein n=1 Tax=Caerostris extrusa TaxID=172846 RepID=A0AAV4MZF5_CAEEX|nr:hypothetical protein CEXT_252651 [Caerostris extrusa]
MRYYTLDCKVRLALRIQFRSLSAAPKTGAVCDDKQYDPGDDIFTHLASVSLRTSFFRANGPRTFKAHQREIFTRLCQTLRRYVAY